MFALSSQCLIQVGKDILDVLDTDRKTNLLGSHAAGGELVVGELAVGGGGGVEGAGAGVGHVHHDIKELQIVEESTSRLAAALDAHGNDTASALGEIFLCELILAVAFEQG